MIRIVTESAKKRLCFIVVRDSIKKSLKSYHKKEALMTRYQEQKGSIHAVVIILLVIALIGALGWIFWQNFSKKDVPTPNSSKGTSSQATKEKSKIDTVEGSISSDFGTTLIYDYPKTWKYSSEITGDKGTAWGQTITLSSPSGNYSVVYGVGQGGGLGGTCSAEEIGTVSTVNYEILSGFPAMSFAVLSLNNMDEVYQDGILSRNGYAGLVNTSVAQDLKTGDTACKLGYAGMQELDATGNTILSNASIKIRNITSAEEFKKKLSDEEYNQAKTILLSTKH